MTSYWISLEVKIDVHVFAKATGVIISVCFRIAKCFQDDVGFDQNIFNSRIEKKTFQQFD